MMNISKAVLCRRLSQIRLTPNILSTTGFSTDVEEKIEIPRRIPRGPTDILRALESTVGRDPTAAHYKYHDDPYLIPLSNNGKRTFAMAQEAGRKAAHWVRRQHPDLFQHKEADPMIEAFAPPMVYTEESEVAIDDLQTSINTAQVSDAVLIYRLLKNKNVEVAPELEQGLLELLCYQNSSEAPSEEFIEERWFRQSVKVKEKVRKTWKDGDLAEEIFNSFENKTAEAYCAMIQGMTKYHQVDRAYQLFEETKQKNIVLNTNTFNSLIYVVNAVKEHFELRWNLVVDLLSQMKAANLSPNLGTLNSVLYVLSYIGNSGLAKQYTLKTLSEFKNLGIEPSLASWYYVLLTFCKTRGPTSTILNDILDLIENKEHKIRDLKDVNFFVTAMEMCRHHLNDVAAATRVDNLLHYGDNYNLIGDSYKESVYYRHLFSLLCANLPAEEFMNDVYYKYVPHIYVPETGIMAEILTQIDANGAIEYVPRLWSDMMVFDQSYRENLVEIIMNTMVNNEQLVNADYNEKFANIAWDIYTRAEEQEESKINKLNLTGDQLGKILMLLLKNREFEKACTVMEKLDKNQQNIAGVPKIEALSLFVDQCIEEKAPSKAIACIQYCTDCGFPEAKQLGAKLHEKLNLDEVLLGRLSKIVGEVSSVKTQDAA
jgi:pentatricopeptide repeat domain-containing protein 3